uniref:Uncharacterized protein n=1 Tax=Ditylenchus dipsaci TaxID=166011 RepID=A0A915CYK8_9BILA
MKLVRDPVFFCKRAAVYCRLEQFDLALMLVWVSCSLLFQKVLLNLWRHISEQFRNALGGLGMEVGGAAASQTDGQQEEQHDNEEPNESADKK